MSGMDRDMEMPQPAAEFFARPMCVKELATSLGHGLTFVYQMRACGFRMTWDATERCEVSTLEKAQRWLKRTKFRLIRGRGVIKG